MIIFIVGVCGFINILRMIRKGIIENLNFLVIIVVIVIKIKVVLILKINVFI